MKRLPVHIFLITLVALFCSCDPTRFLMAGKNPIICRIYSPIETVTHSDPVILIGDSGLVDLSAPATTQYRFSMRVRLMKGDGFALMLRPRAEETLLDSGLAVVLSRTRSHLDMNGMELQSLPRARLMLDSTMVVTVRSDNNFVQVTLGCDTILKGNYPLKEADDIAIGTLPGSQIRVIYPDWQDLKEEDEKDTVKEKSTRKFGLF